MFSRVFLVNCAVCEAAWQNIVQADGLQNTIWRRDIACWIPKATNTHSEYILIIAFLLQQWLREFRLKVTRALPVLSVPLLLS
jgi:hypothetical protein